MKRGLAIAVRIATGLTILWMSLKPAMNGHGFVRVLAIVESIAAAAFCLPRLWRAGGYTLLGVLGFALIHHGLGGQFMTALFFAALVIILELTL
jgi:hypothetical protein